MPNNYGLSALHLACRSNNPGAVYDLLKAPGIMVNAKSTTGASPMMVAAKYCRKEALAGLIQDRRVDLDTLDPDGRKVEEIVGKAFAYADEVDKTEIKEFVARERLGRVEEEGRRDSMEEENIDVDDMHKLRLFSQVVELMGELKALHKQDRVKLINEQAAESQQFDLKIEQDFIALLERHREVQRQYIAKVRIWQKIFHSF